MMKAIILAAGQGQRLKPLTNDRPKAMVQVSGTPIIERQLRLFHHVGITEIAIVKGYCGGSVPDYGLREYMNYDYATTNMVYSLFCAEAELVSGDSVVVSYGDILYSEQVLRALASSEAPVSVVVDLDWKRYFAQRFEDPYDDAESLVLSDDGAITSVGQRNPPREEIQAQYIGLLKFDAVGLRRIRDVRTAVANDSGRLIGWGRPWRQAYMTDLLQELVNRGTQVLAVPVHAGWCEVDSLRDHEIAERLAPTLTP